MNKEQTKQWKIIVTKADLSENTSMLNFFNNNTNSEDSCFLKVNKNYRHIINKMRKISKLFIKLPLKKILCITL